MNSLYTIHHTPYTILHTGIYFAAKSGRMAGQAVSKMVREKSRLPSEKEMIAEYIKPYDKLYGPTYTVLDILQRVFYTSNAAREAFVELCRSEYVQRVTFNSYLYKKVSIHTPYTIHHTPYTITGHHAYPVAR
ncbi:hypothetical protein EON64_10265 [archaeon]|nr:MAG: hypothetical protein EON64_10265 [archaeon]